MGTSTPHSRRAQWLGVGALILTATLWSWNGPLIKLLNQNGAGVPAVTIAFYRSFLGGLLIAPWSIRQWHTRLEAPLLLRVAAVVAFTLMTITFIVTASMTTAASAIVLQYTSPMWVVLLSPFLLGERVPRGEAAILLIAMAGIAVIFLGAPVGARLPVVIGIGSGVSYAFVQLTVRGLRRVHPATVACVNAIGSALLLLPAVFVWGSFALTGRQFLLMAVLGLVPFAFPYVLYAYAARHVQAYRAALIVLLEIVLTPIWTYLVVGEEPPRSTLVGGVLILVSVATWVLLTWRRARRA
ncbi:MAG: DMT family transporter [Candidatus Poribacteria bacterium]